MWLIPWEINEYLIKALRITKNIFLKKQDNYLKAVTFMLNMNAFLNESLHYFDCDCAYDGLRKRSCFK